MLDYCCFRNSFYGDFGLNHVFAVTFSPILVHDQSWQEKYYVNVKNTIRGVSLSKVLNLHEKILLWHKLDVLKIQIEPIFGFEKDFIRKATIESGNDFDAMLDAIGMYEEEKNAKFRRTES